MNNKLKYLRELNNLTQEDVANYLNVKRQNISRWETNELFIPLYHLNSLSNLFNVNIDYLIGLTNNIIILPNIKEINLNTVANNLKEIRKNDLNISMREFSKILNTSHSTISAYENSNNLIIISFALELAIKFNISIDWLIGKSQVKYLSKPKIAN